MFALPTMAVLFVFMLLRPHEAIESLKTLPFNPIAAAVLVTYLLDVRVKASVFRSSPLLGLGFAFFVVCALSIVLKAGDRVGFLMPGVGASFIAFFVVAHGLKSFRAIESAAAVLLTITVLLAAFGIHQGLQPLQCYATVRGAVSGETLDGRPCVSRDECFEGGQTGNDYLCERPGLFNTHSVGGRVRYLGLLKDPNELSWAVGMGAPLAFALYETRRSLLRLLMLLATLGLVATCVVMSQSRSGQLTFAAMLGVYFVKRFGWKGAAAAAIAMAPVMLFGGRSGDEAKESTEERLGCWAEGLNMFRSSPLIGVGNGQFTEHHYLTAHSSIVLTLAEMGPLGLFLWTAVIYFAFKITVRIQMEFATQPEAAPARTWALAILASLAGLLVSAAFLSIPYHSVLWIYVALSGAVYGTVRAHQPDFRVRFGWRDVALVSAIDFVTVGFIAVYVRVKGAG